ncbi:MAG: AAA family ATPase, partial [Burkholderiaceae bacterium]
MPSSDGSGLVAGTLLDATATHRVYASEWAATHEACVIKVLVKEARDADTLARLRSEAQVLKLLEELSVAHIPRVLELDARGGVLIETRMPGVKLSALPPELLRDVPRAIQFALDLLAILAPIHTARVFHGDLHPANILYDASDDGVALVDFGKAVAQSHVEATTDAGGFAGQALPFGAPEQTGRIGRVIDYRTDFYALGAVLYWALTGRAPFVESDPLALLHALLTRTPEPLRSFNNEIDASLVAVVDKLLAKNCDERYQSAHGLDIDLQHCLAIALGAEDGASFVVGHADHRSMPAQPSRLVGRGAERDALVAALQARDGRARVAMVHGYSGAGKSALVHALYPWLNDGNGIVAAGKFEQFQRSVPFGGLAAALSQLAQAWRAEAPAEVAKLRLTLRERLASNADLLARMVPGFGALLADASVARSVDDEAPEPDLANVLARMQQALAVVLSLARERGRPLLLFVDDLQWADANSMALLQGIALDQSRAGLLLIGAYRDNEIEAGHPLELLLEDLRRGGVEIVDVAIAGLLESDVRELVADVLDDEAAEVDDLARTLHHKTAGNAFFVLQYLRQLFDAGHLMRAGSSWLARPDALAALPSSENLVAGLVEELKRLPPATRRLAAGCACIGRTPDAELLAEVERQPIEQIDAALLRLLRREMLLLT